MKRVEEDDGSIVAIEICGGVERRGENGVGYDEVEQRSFAGSGWVVGW